MAPSGGTKRHVRVRPSGEPVLQAEWSCEGRPVGAHHPDGHDLSEVKKGSVFFLISVCGGVDVGVVASSSLWEE